MNEELVVEEVLFGSPALGVEEIDVYCWRMERMLVAGYPHLLADALAANSGVDLHLACDLLANGCDSRTAYSILS